MDPATAMIIGSAGAQAGNMISSFTGGHKEFRRQRDLMNKQFANQKTLNIQGHDLSYDMWKKTNYSAQLEQMKKAGLNPALMYGQGGPGGTTQSGSGGSAAGGQAPTNEMLGIDLAGSMAKITEALVNLSKKDNIEESTNVLGAQVGLIGAQTLSALQSVEESKMNVIKKEAETLSINLDNELKAGTLVNNINMVKANYDSLKNTLDLQNIEKDKQRTIIKGLEIDNATKIIEQNLLKAQIDVTKKQLEVMAQNIVESRARTLESDARGKFIQNQDAWYIDQMNIQLRKIGVEEGKLSLEQQKALSGELRAWIDTVNPLNW